MKATYRGRYALGVLALVALVSVSAAEAGEKESYGSCRAGNRICPAGEGVWLCWAGNGPCPEVRTSKRGDIPKCGPMERLCQVSENSYVCRHVDEKCPDSDLLLVVPGKGCAPKDGD
jgi:hypothetical protein